MKRQDVQPIYKRARNRGLFFGWGLVFFIALILIGGGYGIYRYHRNQILKEYPIKGVSISQANGYIDFEQLKTDGYKFVYIRASQGSVYTDDSFDNNFQRSQGSQLPIGVYHVFSFSSSPNSQFTNFTRQVGYDTGSLPIAISVQPYSKYNEDTLDYPRVSKELKLLISKLKNYYKRPVIIWTKRSMVSQLKLRINSRQQSWLSDGRLGHPNSDATFISADQNAAVETDNQTVFLNESVFNGTVQEWHNYLNKNLSQ
ncbi:GH25 family lysozyme [Lentilactobacillus sp. SPB1-3]|uniref:GH25 family lysozyme n=1 Tax=Lentilactobacillus terminaliae TaxID=3003483 RepID=A0ACD5DGW1_9LACO|nr:GH25 family lysozyme [Lentilactobacillus sp. SPB1-3]MCZ0976821.1 GH25 family lysozyme [Lentilactobacillus sp. SPB1-3]